MGALVFIPCFNSIIVRLKVDLDSQKATDDGSFNSIIVRLKGYLVFRSPD